MCFKGERTLEGTVKTEQELLTELHELRFRVATLEKEVEQRNSLLHREQGARKTIEVAFETLADGVLIYDNQGNILRMNAAYRNLIALDERMVPYYLSLPFEARAELLHMRYESMPADMEKPTQYVTHRQVLTGADAVEISLQRLEDGQKRAVSISSAPITDSDGTVTGTVAIFRDVTERRQLERRTQEALHTLLAMAEILVQDMHSVDDVEQEQHTERTNDIAIQRLIELTQQVLGCRCVTIMKVEARSELLTPLAIIGASAEEEHCWHALYANTSLEQHFQQRAPKLAELRAGNVLTPTIALPDGIKHQYLLVPIRLGCQLIGLLTIDYNEEEAHQYTHTEIILAQAVSRLTALVLERSRLLQERATSQANELALREANRRMDEILSLASHELRTPLTTMNGNIQLARRRLQALLVEQHMPQETLSKFDVIYDMLNRAERQVQIQNRLVGDLLDVSRIQSQHLELHLHMVDIVTLVRQTLDDICIAFPSRTILFTPRTPPEQEILVAIDSDRISQVLTNYVMNALKYSSETSPITVGLEQVESTVRVCVRDKGPGIASAEQEHIWQRFYKAPGIVTLSGSSVGLGLGLYISRNIIELHEGKAGLHSVEGQGSTFWFSLPCL